MSIIQIPTSNFWANRNGYKPRWIILHGTAGGSSPEGVARDFINSQGTSNPKSTHYVIGQDGSIVQCVQEKDAAWGNGVPERGCDPWWNNGVNPNLTTISIEHVKPDTTNGIALTAAQAKASFALVNEICDRWGIPKRKADASGGITGHFSISPVDRARCPGTYPWQDLFVSLGNSQGGSSEDMLQITDPFAHAYFQQQDNDHWYCPNTKQTIAFGILNYYRITQGAARLPLSGEIYSIPDVAYQIFEAGVIVWDPKNKMGGPGGNTFFQVLNSDQVKSAAGLDSMEAQIKADDALIAQLQAKFNADQAEITKLQAELAATQPVDKTGIASDLNAASASIADALKKVS